MTRDEAIEILEDEMYVIWESASEKTFAMTRNEAFDMAIEAIKNKRPKGHWIPQNHNKTNGMVSTLVYYYPKCSVCGHCANYTNFCPNCGADMRGE